MKCPDCKHEELEERAEECVVGNSRCISYEVRYKCPKCKTEYDIDDLER